MSWDPPLPYAILLQDDDGHKNSDKITANHVRRGTLLARLSQEEVRRLVKQHQTPGLPVCNFKCLEDPNIKLHCSASDVRMLNEKEKELLHGVANPPDRFDALKRLEWAENLKEGSTVYVNIRAFPTAAKGILHYIGNLPGEIGIRFGVELLVCKIKF